MSTTINGFHLFTVEEYSRLKKMDVGSCISSDTFSVGGYDWEVDFYPNGEGKKDKGYVSVYLELVNDGPEVEAWFEYTLLDQSGKGVHKVNNISVELYKKWSGWGQDIMKKHDLESSDYLKDDSLSICCMVQVVQSCIRPKDFTIIPPPPEMEKDFKYLLESEIGSDIVFRVKNVTFKAHKAILAARSPVFKAQFYGLVGNLALDEVVELIDIEPSVFKAMLLFIYSDKLTDSQDSVRSMAHMIQHLLVAADRFGLDRLKHLCEAKLGEELNVDIVATTLSFAHDHHCSQLKTFCMNFAAANLRGVIQTEGYKYIETSCPLLLSELLQKIASQS